MKVCHIVSGDQWAGAEVQIATLLSELAKHSDLTLSAVLMNEGRLAETLRSSGASVKIIDERKSSSARILWQLFSFLKARRIDVVHTHRYKENVLGTIAAKLSGVPHVVRTIHGLREPFTGIKRLKMNLYMALDHLTARYADRVIAVSQDIDARLSRRYGRERVLCIHNAVPMTHGMVRRDAREKRRELSVPAGTRIIGTAGRLVPIKGYDDFLRAAQIVVQKRPDVRFLLIGEGPFRTRLQQLAKDLAVEEYVHFLGFREDIYDLINIMDVCVLSSLHEGIPTIALEALALGKPVVATRVGGMPEVITDEALGALVDVQNPMQLAEKCLEILNQSPEEEAVKTQRMRYVADKFSSRAMAEKVREAYITLGVHDL